MRTKVLILGLGVLGTCLAQMPVEVVRVEARAQQRTIALPGEFEPYQAVDIHARVTGFVEAVHVDRGSVVKEGDLLATLSAPELTAQRLAAEAKAEAARAGSAGAGARLASARSTFARMQAASKTPGAVAGNELLLAEKEVEAAEAEVRAVESSIRAAEASVAALKEMEAYLRVTAPFAGVITRREVHPGALVGPSGAGSQTAMFRLEQNQRLRLVVAVPEVDVGGIADRARVAFTVPAWPGRTFTGVLARVAHSMDPKTRSMAVELDVDNPQGRLAPGMYPTVMWPVRKAAPALVVPATAVVTTTERTFVVRVRDGMLEWVTVAKGPAAGTHVEVRGALKAGDLVVMRATDELRAGTRVAAKEAQPRSRS